MPRCAALLPEKLAVVLYGTQGEVSDSALPQQGWAAGDLQHALRRRDHQLAAPLQRYQLGLHPRQDLRVYERAGLPDLQGGKRLRHEALAVTVDERQYRRADRLAGGAHAGLGAEAEQASRRRSPPRQQAIAERILKEIHDRLGFLVNVGPGLPDLAGARRPRSPAARRSASAWRPRSARA